VVVRVLDARGRAALRGSARHLTGSRSLALRRLRRLTAGRHVVVLTAKDAAGRAVRVQQSLRVTR
jgi:hypothetical protein